MIWQVTSDERDAQTTTHPGDSDRQKPLKFLDKHAATMPRTLLRYSIEHLDKDQREHYLSLKKAR
jgi:hypothetical protein